MLGRVTRLALALVVSACSSAEPKAQRPEQPAAPAPSAYCTSITWNGDTRAQCVVPLLAPQICRRYRCAKPDDLAQVCKDMLAQIMASRPGEPMTASPCTPAAETFCYFAEAVDFVIFECAPTLALCQKQTSDPSVAELVTGGCTSDPATIGTWTQRLPR